MPPSIQREAAARIPQQPQAQYSLVEQLEVLVVAANKLGLYDAATYIAQDAVDSGRGALRSRVPKDYNPQDCSCKKVCGDVPGDQDHKYAICKGLPE